MPKELCREEAFQPAEYFTWDIGIQRLFHLDAADVDKLEKGGTVFRGDTAYSLEEKESED